MKSNIKKILVSTILSTAFVNTTFAVNWIFVFKLLREPPESIITKLMDKNITADNVYTLSENLINTIDKLKINNNNKLQDTFINIFGPKMDKKVESKTLTNLLYNENDQIDQQQLNDLTKKLNDSKSPAEFYKEIQSFKTANPNKKKLSSSKLTTLIKESFVYPSNEELKKRMQSETNKIVENLGDWEDLIEDDLRNKYIDQYIDQYYGDNGLKIIKDGISKYIATLFNNKDLINKDEVRMNLTQFVSNIDDVYSKILESRTQRLIADTLIHDVTKSGVWVQAARAKCKTDWLGAFNGFAVGGDFNLGDSANIGTSLSYINNTPSSFRSYIGSVHGLFVLDKIILDTSILIGKLEFDYVTNPVKNWITNFTKIIPQMKSDAQQTQNKNNHKASSMLYGITSSVRYNIDINDQIVSPILKVAYYNANSAKVINNQNPGKPVELDPISMLSTKISAQYQYLSTIYEANILPGIEIGVEKDVMLHQQNTTGNENPASGFINASMLVKYNMLDFNVSTSFKKPIHKQVKIAKTNLVEYGGLIGLKVNF